MAYATSREPAGARLSDFALTMTFCTMIWAAGLLVSRRDRTARDSEERASAAERSRAEHARAATGAERARIATELHDIVSHGLSVVIVQTVAARQLLDDARSAAVPSSGDVDRRMASVESTAREALADMRRMLGLLQSTTDADDDSAGDPGTGGIDGRDVTGPSPGIDSLPRLLDLTRASGVAVTTSGFESLPAVPAALSLTMYRIVQETLTNVIKHAPGASATVDAGLRAGALHLTVTNSAGPVGDVNRIPFDRAPVGAGRGLIGLEQRVAVYGGSCRAEALGDGGFQVEVSLPFDTASQHGPSGLPSIEHA
jgi:signal transduction histidine kinase